MKDRKFTDTLFGRHRWMLHTVFWLGWTTFARSFFFDFADGSVNGTVEFALNIGLHMAMFYLMAYRVAPQMFSERRKIWWRLVWYPVRTLGGLLLFLIVLSIALGGLKVNFGWGLPLQFHIVNIKPVLMPFFPGMVLGILFYGVRWGAVQFVALHKVKVFSTDLLQSLSASRQSELMMRVLPHLLLNLLPSLERIAKVDYERSSIAFDKAYDIFRYFAALPPGVRIPAWEEIRQVYKLIAVKSMALGFEIPLRWECDKRLSDLMILPMSIFGLVENVLKYAVLGKSDALPVVRVGQRDGMVFIETENAVIKGAKMEGNGLGMGLKNLREQMANLLDRDFSLETDQQGDRFFVMLTYPMVADDME